MAKRKLIAFLLTAALLFTTWAPPYNLGILADQEDRELLQEEDTLGEDMPLMVDREELASVDETATGDSEANIVGMDNALQAGDKTEDGKTVLDIGLGDINIYPATGAEGGGLSEAETELNPDGYYIISSTGETAHTLTMHGKAQENTATGVIPGEPIETKLELDDGVSFNCAAAPLNIGENATLELTLNNNNITVSKPAENYYSVRYSGINIGRTSVVTLNLNGENHISASHAPAIAVYDKAELTINGGVQDKLYATVNGDYGAAAIGARATNASGTGNKGDNISYIQATQKVFQRITINGGQIYATGSKNGPGIGTNNKHKSDNWEAEIIINGGYIEAKTAETSLATYQVTLGLNARQAVNTKAVIINGGSVNAVFSQTAPPVNGDGQALRKVEASVPADRANAVFELTNYLNEPMEVVATEDCKLYLMLPTTDTVVAAVSGGKNYLGNIQPGAAEGDPYTVVLEANETPCDCTPDTASFAIKEQEILVYALKGEGSVRLTADFTPAEACEYPAHTVQLTYSLAEDTPSSWAALEGNVLTAYAAADGQTITVQAEALVNGKTYTDAAQFTVRVDDSYVLDMVEGSVVIGSDTIKITEFSSSGKELTKKTYDRTDKTKSIRICQSAEGVLDRYIYVEPGVQADITLDNVRLNNAKKITFKATLHIDNMAKVNLTLVGSNELNAADPLYTPSMPAVYVNGSSRGGAVLTIDGDGSLVVRTDGTDRKEYPAMGATYNSAHGDIVINGGRITAYGGSEAPAIGTGKQGADVSSKVIINGGLLLAVRGADTDAQNPRDIKAAVTINGGSVATIDAAGNVDPNICFYSLLNSGKPSELPHNSAGDMVYRTVLQLEDSRANAEVTYWVKDGSKDETGPYKAFTDNSGKLYLYLPASDNYQRIRAEVGDDTYYKRMVIEENNDNTGEMIRNTDAQIVKFAISGQLGETVIDHTARTIKLTMPAGMDISKVTPTVETEGAEYKPATAQDFGNSLEHPLEYTVIDDSGTEIVYQVMVTQRPLAPGEKTVLDVSNGNIRMLEMPNGVITVTVGGMAILPNENGYIITGHNEDAYVYIDGIAAPIVFRDLDLACDKAAGRAVEFYPNYVTKDGITGNNSIIIEGVNHIRGVDSKRALVLNGNDGGVPSQYVFDGEGILKLSSDRSQAVIGVNTTKFIIEGGNVTITDGGSSSSKQPVNENGESIYPITITIDNPLAAGQVVKYKDNYMDAAKTILADEDGRITVWRKNALYSCTVTLGEGNDNVCHGSVQVEGADKQITVGVPQITRFTNRMPQSALGNDKWRIDISGSYLGGDMLVTATGENGEKISGTPVQESETLWSVYLKIPDNDHLSEYTYTLSATIDGVTQTNIKGDTSFTMLGELRMASFKIIQAGYQVGDEEIGEDESGQKYVHVNVAYDIDLEEAAISALMKPDEAFFSPANGQRRVFKANPKYGNTHTQLYQVSNNMLFGAGDTVEYLVTLFNQPTPVVNGVSVGEVDYRGGKVEVSLFGENFGSLLNAVNYQNEKDPDNPMANEIIVTVNGQDYPLTDNEIKGGKTKLEVTVPDNLRGTQSKHYPLTVSINGVEQKITSLNGEPLAEDETAEIVVPGELEMDATITNLSFIGQLDYETGNPMGYDRAVIKHNGDNETGTIDVTVPWRTELSELTPYITLTNHDATYTPTGALSQIPSGEDNPVSAQITITVTAVKGNTKDYLLTITRIPTPSEHSAVIKSFTFGEQLHYEPGNPMGYDKPVIKDNGDDEVGTIDIIVPWRTELANLTPVVKLAHEDATYTPTGVLSQIPGGDDNPVSAKVTYTVTAVDGTTKDYDVTITRVATKQEKDPTIHYIYVDQQLDSKIEDEPDEQGIIPVKINMPRGTDMSALTPELRLGHEDAVYMPEGPQDFTNSVTEPVVYTVTAVDGSTMQYAVSVELRKRSSEDKNKNVSRTIDEESFSAYIEGKDDGLFHPDDKVTRKEAAAMLARMHDKFDKTAEYENSFADVPDSAWYAAYVGFLAQQNIVLGEGGKFIPNADVTRMEFAAMLARFADIAADNENKASFKDIENVWGENEIKALVDEGVIQGYEDGTFRPNKNLNRAEAVSMLNRLVKRGTTKEELAALSKAENPFSDVDEEHWAYNDIINAITDYDRTTDTWVVGSGKEVTVTVELKDKTETAN